MNLSHIKPAHRKMVDKIAASLGQKVEVEKYEEYIDFNVPLDKEDRQFLILRCISDYEGFGWIALLEQYSECFAQSDGDEEAPCRATPQTAYDNLLVRFQASIDKKQELLNRLEEAPKCKHDWIKLRNDPERASDQCSKCKVKGWPSPHGLYAQPYNGN